VPRATKISTEKLDNVITKFGVNGISSQEFLMNGNLRELTPIYLGPSVLITAV